MIVECVSKKCRLFIFYFVFLIESGVLFSVVDGFLWMMDVVAHVFEHHASKGWKSLTRLLHPHLR